MVPSGQTQILPQTGGDAEDPEELEEGPRKAIGYRVHFPTVKQSRPSVLPAAVALQCELCSEFSKGRTLRTTG